MEVPRLRVGDSGDEVARLHEMLKLQGVEVSPEEQKRKFFGPATREAVGEFQKAHGIDPSCEFCEETAALLAGQPKAGLSGVQPVRSTVVVPSPVGLPIAIPSTRKSKAANPSGLDRDSDSAFDPEPTSFVVCGQIRLSDGSPCVAALVRAFDKDLRSQEQLGKSESVTTDTEGRYEITYTAEQFSRVEKRSADLLVEARQNAEAEWIAERIRFNAQPVEVVDITLDGVYRGPSEFRRLVDEITPLLDGLTMAQLTENSDFQDITFLSNEVEWTGNLSRGSQ